MAYTFKHGDRPIEGYTIQRAVGKGGFGEVYYAISDGGREVAIKYLRDNPDVELRGVSHCMNLKSPHLVTIFDVRKTVDGEFAIIMEYISGPSLRDLLTAEPDGLGPEKAAFFVREIAKGLSYLHDRGIVHRDLKPGNIFYDDGYVKIGDYGLSKFISVSRHSGQTASVGTVHYMAPEIGSGNYSKGVDIYALGVIVYEMLLGKVPFEGSSMGEVLMKHLTAQPELDVLPHPFGQVIRRSLQKDPRDRYQSVDEMVDDLLEVETVRESLAGFSAKSLEGAVRYGVAERPGSPMPSPNPMPGYGQYGKPTPPPFAQPVGPPRADLPPRLRESMDRVADKLGARVTALGKRSPGGPPPGPPPHENTGEAAAQPPPGGVAPATGVDRRKRMLLSGLLSVGLAVGLGILVGTNIDEEFGVGAGMLVVAMSGAIVLARAAVNWFGVEHGPVWSQRLVRLCCGAPILAIGAAPIFEHDSDQGAALWLGLLLITVLWNWEKTIQSSSTGEMSFGRAIGAAGLTLAVCAALAGMFGAGPEEEVMFVGAGVAGAVALVIQATAWWLPNKTTQAMRYFGPPPPPPPARGNLGGVPQAPQPRFGGGGFPTPGEAPAAHQSVESHGTAHLPPSQTTTRRTRWGITRAFWGLIAFVLMGGAIVTFLMALIAETISYHDRTGAILACVAFASSMVFALRKTTPMRRIGFWRETLRPFILSVLMFAIAATITLISREWHCGKSVGLPCLGDEGRVACVAGLVVFSLLFVLLSLFTGRRRRPRQPFLRPADPSDEGGAPGLGAAEPVEPDTPESARAVQETT